MNEQAAFWAQFIAAGLGLILALYFLISFVDLGISVWHEYKESKRKRLLKALCHKKGDK